MIGNLSGENLVKLIQSGAVHCLYSTSTTPKWLGDLTSVHFFNAQWKEIAHQTMLESANNYTEYSRSWGFGFNGSREGYRNSYRFDRLFEMYQNNDIIPSAVYSVI